MRGEECQNIRYMVDKIDNFMAEDRRVSIKTITTQFRVGVLTIHRIIYEDLNMREKCSLFVHRVHGVE